MNRLTKNARTPIYTTIIAAAMTLAGSAQAQMLEEVIVTAQKRAESLQDVPISITTVSGEKMIEAGIFKIEDLQAFTPNLSMTETGISTQIYIRGIGTGNNQGFEQSVGTYVDGVYYGRQQLLRMPFMDVERIEVLRGPQSILFGKNSIAGALNMTTAKPSDELEGSISGSYSPDSEIIDLKAMISGPITDSLAGRLVVRKYDEDGYSDNTFHNQDEPERDEFAIRGSLRWDVSDDLRIDFKAEYDEFDVTGRQIEIVQDDPNAGGATFAQIMGSLGHPGAITEIKQNNKRQADTGDTSDNEVQNYTLSIDYQLGGLNLTAISGWVSYDFLEFCDCDFIGAPIFEAVLDEEYEQFSQEIRLTSPGDETIDWIAGVFYQTSELDYGDNVVIFDDSVLGLVSGGALAPLTGTEWDRVFEQDSDLWAVFAQGTWNISDTLRLTLGARYTEEDKDALRTIDIIDSDTRDITTSPAAPTLWTAVLAVENEQLTGHNLKGDLDENAFTPLVNVQWDATDDMMLYASWSTGFKSGGFDARANVITSWEFDEEEATTFELGAKTTLLDGAAELNIAIYRTEYDDLQVAQFDGTLGFTVGNAKETTVQGVEIDGRWAITDNLIMTYGLAYLDHEFDDFRNGNCYNRQVPDGDIVGGVQLCDYTGKSGQYTPEWTGTLSFNHVMSLTDSLDLRSGVDVNYADEQNTHVNLDPQYVQDDYTKVNLRVGLYAPNWDVAVLAQNITDEQQLTYVGNAPLSGGTFGTNTFYSFISRPSTVYLQASYHF